MLARPRHFAARRRAWLSCIELCDKRGPAHRHRPPVRGPARGLGSYLMYTCASEEERAPPTMPRPTACWPRPRSRFPAGMMPGGETSPPLH